MHYCSERVHRWNNTLTPVQAKYSHRSGEICTMFVIDTAAPKTAQIIFQRLRFTDALKGTSPHILYQHNVSVLWLLLFYRKEPPHMAISKVKPRHASEGRSIAAVLAERIDYGKTRRKRTAACWSLASCVPRKRPDRNLPFPNRSTPPPPGAGVPQIKM